ncbi:MAG: phospholipase D-like domain-containing protein [Planctomycetota bacterium]
MSEAFQVSGSNADALFTLKVHRGEGMCLLAMNWRNGKPPADFVGFAIEYREPGGTRFFQLKNRLNFLLPNGKVDPVARPTRLAPIQMFRWVHFPRNAELAGDFTYVVTPVFMNTADELSYGEPQQVAIQLRRETYPGELNVCFTRGFVSSQAFVDRYGKSAIAQLLPAKADDGLDFSPSHPEADEALAWMGFEARNAILELLEEAIADESAQVRAVLYDLNEPGIVSRLERLGTRLMVIVDDDGSHGKASSSESRAVKRLMDSAGASHVKRQHLGKLQHNKTVVVDGKNVQAALCGSTNHSWRGLYVQNNNAIVARGAPAVKVFMTAFENYWNSETAADFAATESAVWQPLGVAGLDIEIGFSPRSKQNAVLTAIAEDVKTAESSLFFSLAFLYQTPGAIRNAIKAVKSKKQVFSYGISDHAVEDLNGKTATGVALQKPDGKVTVVQPSALSAKVPEPFKSEPTGGSGTRMHHKFLVVDFDKPTARVYMGSYNFSVSADTSNGENLLVIRDRRIAVAYVVEALRIFDHYHFRVRQEEAKTAKGRLHLTRPPRKASEKPWWSESYSNARKIRDRELFA